ncbi:MAG: DUF2116 family Zn-ribbon domain-containing protein [Candidatus Bathyarchaeia archaeon]
MPRKKKSSIVDHTHCWYCDKAIPRDEVHHFCSPECRSKHRAREAEQKRAYKRRQYISLIPVIVFAIVAVFLYLTGNLKF